MKIVNPSAEVLFTETGDEMMKRIEAAGRTAYKSEDKITDQSAEAFVRTIITRGHMSVLEHVSVSARVVCDRGVTHEIVRHRIASYTQESTRYCNYAGDKYGSEITVVLPEFLREAYSMVQTGCFVDEGNSPKLGQFLIWQRAMENVESAYMELLELKASPQEARSVLPNSLKTEIVMTMNLREWLHFFNLRTSPKAHPDMQVVAKMLLVQFNLALPCIYGELAKERIGDHG